jgi:hypothetical protein
VNAGVFGELSMTSSLMVTRSTLTFGSRLMFLVKKYGIDIPVG